VYAKRWCFVHDTKVEYFLFISIGPEMACTLQEERSLKLQVEGKLLQLEKDHSMLDCDYKQAQHRLDELQAQKEKLSEEVLFTP